MSCIFAKPRFQHFKKKQKKHPVPAVQQLNTRLKETPRILWGFCRCDKADISILKVSTHLWFIYLVFCTSESRAVQNAPWANRMHVSFGSGNKWGGRILSSSAVNVILTAEKLVQTCWLHFGSKKKKLSNAVTFLSDHNFHACHFFPGWKKQTAVWRKSVSRSGFEDGGWFAFDKLLSELVQL